MRPRDERTPRHRRSGRHGVRTRPTALLAVAAAVGACLTGALLATAGPRQDLSTAVRRQVDLVEGPARTSRPGERAPTPVAAPPARGPVVRAAAVLRGWDEQRARAWAAGDVRRLRGLYVAGAGVADVRLLRSYAERGYRVEGLTTQLLAVEVLERSPVRWRLRVTDRIAGGVTVRAGERLRLPRDRADTRVVELVRAADGDWLVAEVRPVRR